MLVMWSHDGIRERALVLDDDGQREFVDIMPLRSEPAIVEAGYLQIRYIDDLLTEVDLMTLQGVLGRKFCDMDIHRIDGLGESVVAMINDGHFDSTNGYMVNLQLHLWAGRFLTPAQMRGAANILATRGRAMVTGQMFGSGEPGMVPGGPYETLIEGLQAISAEREKLTANPCEAAGASGGAEMSQDTGVGGSEAEMGLQRIVRGIQPPLGTFAFLGQSDDGAYDDIIVLRVKPDFRKREREQGWRMVQWLERDDDLSSLAMDDWTGVAFISPADAAGAATGTIWQSINGQRLARVSMGLERLLAAGDEIDADGYFYALQSGRCWMCNRPLKVRPDLYGGRGGRCARRDWRTGEKQSVYGTADGTNWKSRYRRGKQFAGLDN
jgi:hypothetical protein